MPIVIYGLKELRAELKEVSKAAPREINAALKEGAKTITARAVQLAPVKTGAMRGTAKPFSTARAAGVRFTSPYASVHEFATVWHRRARGGIALEEQVRYVKGLAPPRFAFRAVEELADGLVDVTFDRLVQVLRGHGWFR